MDLGVGKIVELVGGPLDGTRVVVHQHITEYQKARTVETYYIYRETVCTHKDGLAHIFNYAGVGS